MNFVMFALLLNSVSAAFLASPTPHHTSWAASPALLQERAPPVAASAVMLPVAYTGLGVTLLTRAAGAGAGTNAVVLASTGLLSVLNLGPTDNARYASGKRAVAAYKDKVSLPYGAMAQAEIAKKWFTLLKWRLIGQVVSLVSMARASSAAGILAGAAGFMATNVAFCLLGGLSAKHDMDGIPAPTKPKLQKFILTTDSVLLCAALLGALSGPGATVAAYVYSAGALIGAVEGAPQFMATVKGLLGSE